jgi:hypothetical protein
MLPAADVAAVIRAPVVTVRSGVIGEGDAVRAKLTHLSPGVAYVLRFHVRGRPAGGVGCVTSATRRLQAGSASGRRVALVPRSVWCAGDGVLSAAAIRRGASAGTVRLRVRPPQALGRGDLVGRLLLGPTCPVERADDPCDPVARPAPVTLVALNASGAEAARTTTLGDGSFALDLPAGTYTLRAERTGAAFPSIADTTVVVTTRATRSRPQRVVVTGDTGIR